MGAEPGSLYVDGFGHLPFRAFPDTWTQSKFQKLFVFRAYLSLLVTFRSAPLYSVPRTNRGLADRGLNGTNRYFASRLLP
jgi:hypothetical protein